MYVTYVNVSRCRNLIWDVCSSKFNFECYSPFHDNRLTCFVQNIVYFLLNAFISIHIRRLVYIYFNSLVLHILIVWLLLLYS